MTIGYVIVFGVCMFLLGMICGGKLAYYDIKIQKQKNDETVKDMKDRFMSGFKVKKK